MSLRHVTSFTGLLLFCSVAIAQFNMDLRSVKTYHDRMSDVWGYTDTSDNEYGLVGVYDGLSIVDVTNPDSINELFFLPGPSSTWRDIKTWQHYAYVTNESREGLFIVDLSMLPDSVNSQYWTADTAFWSAHNIWIDENGYAYLWGYNDRNGNVDYLDKGALVIDLNQDPTNPTIVGRYASAYVHDGFVRGDTMWTSELSEGEFGIVDVSDKANPLVINTRQTPNRFTHNCWPSDDGKTLFTTDERSGAFITSYDVTDPGNITELDRFQADPGSGLIPHNTHFINNYLVTSYYKYGVNIVDATEPDNLVEVGFYDTSPFPSESGFSGCWGAYPYFPSGTMLATDIENGLFVLTPNYQRACYLEGFVDEADFGTFVKGVSIEIMATGVFKETNFQGRYKTGIGTPGTYDIRFTHDGCIPKIITNVNLSRGNVITLDVTLDCSQLTDINDPYESRFVKAKPNIFSQNTTIEYQTLSSSSGTINIFDLNGKKLQQVNLVDPAGAVVLGDQLMSGMYLIQFDSKTFQKTLRIVKY